MEIEYRDWVFGLCCNNDYKTELWVFIIEKKCRQTFLQIYNRKRGRSGTTIHSDQC